MPSFLSWISGLFSPRPQPLSPERPSRLLNPAHGTVRDEAVTDPALQKLEEHLFCWLLDATPSQLNKPSEHTKLVLTELGDRIDRGALDELPRQPLTLPMLLRALSDETSNRSKLTKIILSDAALTDQLLQMVNSPFFRPGEEAIESVDHAIYVLGFDGIRSVLSASLLRPVVAAKNSSEALFAQRVWRWGLTCARSSELIAQIHGEDADAYFMVGLLPALSYLTLRREIHRIYRSRLPGTEVEPQVICEALQRFDWTTAQLLANDWNLPARFHAHLLAAERPAPGAQHTPLNDGMIMGTREVLRHARQRNLAEDDLRQVIMLSEGQFNRVRTSVLSMLSDSGTTPHTH